MKNEKEKRKKKNEMTPPDIFKEHRPPTSFRSCLS
jgi:hypothetical protein